MKYIKSVCICIILIILSLNTFSQVTKYKSTSFSFKTKNENTLRWSKWSEPESAEILITIDLTSDRIKIFSEEEQVYDIIQYYKMTTDVDDDETLKFQCVNEDGLKCFVRFVILKSQNGRKQLYVDFADMSWMYNIYKMD